MDKTVADVSRVLTALRDVTALADGAGVTGAAVDDGFALDGARDVVSENKDMFPKQR